MVLYIYRVNYFLQNEINSKEFNSIWNINMLMKKNKRKQEK